jgi:hypothetical protein
MHEVLDAGDPVAAAPPPPPPDTYHKEACELQPAAPRFPEPDAPPIVVDVAGLPAAADIAQSNPLSDMRDFNLFWLICCA